MVKQNRFVVSWLLAALVAAVLLPGQQARAATGAVEPARGPQGTTFTFTVTGLENNEEIGAWLVDPTGEHFDIEQELIADSSGRVSWTWTASEEARGGAWELTVLTFITRERFSIPFVIDAPESPPAIQPSYMIMPGNSGPPGTEFTFVARGRFAPGEQVGSWFVLPDGRTTDAEYGISADATGQVYRVWTAPGYVQAGNWVFRIRGTFSGFEMDIPFSIVPASGETESPPPTPQPTPQPTANVSPQSGPRGTTFSFRASGFYPDEQVGVWFTLPDGTAQRDYEHDWMKASEHSGDLEWSWIAPADAPEGTWHVHTEGRHSRVRLSIPFTIEGHAIPPTPINQPVISVSPEQDGQEKPFIFRAVGFMPGEDVFYWATSPEGRPVPNHKTAKADSSGVAVWEWAVDADELPGQWHMSARGDASRKEAQAYFFVVGSDQRDVRAEQLVGKPGETLSFSASGFFFREEMSFWLTAPEMPYRRFDQKYDLIEDIQADEQGNVAWVWTIPDRAFAGEWRMTVRGDDSRLEQVIAFQVVRDEPLPDLFGVSPAEGSPGTTFSFFADDIPTDRASIWLTRPDGSIVPEDHADFRDHWIISLGEDGRYQWTWTAPDDAQPGTWLMVIRNRSEEPRLDPDRMDDTAERQHEKARYTENRIDSVLEYRQYAIPFTVTWGAP